MHHASRFSFLVSRFPSWRTLLSLAILLPLLGCSAEPEHLSDRLDVPPAAPNTVRIVSSLPRKGVTQAQTALMVQAIDMAIEERQGELAGWNVEHIALDGGSEETGQWSAQREERNARFAIQDPSVIAYIGPYNSAAAKISLPMTGEARLLQVSPTITWPGVTRGGWERGEPDEIYYLSGRKLFARMMPPDAWQGWAAAHWAAEAQATHVYVLQDVGSSYSKGLARHFIETSQALGLRVSSESILTTAQVAQLSDNIIDSGADALFYAPSTITKAVNITREIRSLPFEAGVFMTDVAMHDLFIEAAQDAGHQWYITYNGVTDMGRSPKWGAFKAAFERKYGSEPSQFAANAYDLTTIILDALKETGGIQRESIARRVLATQRYQGVTGDVSFDAVGDVKQWRLSGYRLSGETLEFVRHFDSPPSGQ